MITMKTTTIRFYEYIADIFCPNRCVCCDRIILWNKLFCDECESAVSMSFIEEEPDSELFDDQIGGRDASFDYAQALYYYEDKAAQAIIGLKRRNGLKFARYAAELLCAKAENDNMGTPDFVTAVPMYFPKKLMRGYNQADVIARHVAECFNIPARLDILGHKKSVEQHTLGEKERLTAAENAYYIKDKSCKLSGCHVLICDDVFTTGATLNSCAALLKQAGAKRVSVLAICKRRRNGGNAKSKE